MKSNGSGWGVTVMGALLVIAGAYGMWFGWGIILNERGWSSFIAGATALSAGVVTIALGRVIRQLALLAAQPQTQAAPSQPKPSAKAPEPARSVEDAAQAVAPAPQIAERQPTEVDRYTNGDEVYAMFSDGTVEVSGPGGFKRYPSIAALRADAAARKA